MNPKVVLFLFGGCVAQVVAADRAAHLTRLKRDLFMNYDKDVLPVKSDDTPLDVKAGANVNKVELLPNGELKLSAWFRSMWKDYRLQWDPSEYGNISTIRISPRMLWIPDLEIYNSVSSGPGTLADAIFNGKHRAVLMSSGDIIYIPPFEERISCDESDFANWPWGEYSCSLKMGSWTLHGHLINLTNWMDGTRKTVDEEKPGCFETADFLKGSQFIVTENSCLEDPVEHKYYDCCPEPYTSITYKFKVQRRVLVNPATGEVSHNPDLVPAYTA